MQAFIKAISELGKMPLSAGGRAKAKTHIVNLFMSLGNSFEIELAIKATRGLAQQAAINGIKHAVTSLADVDKGGSAEAARHVDAALDTLHKDGGGVDDVTGIDEATDCSILLQVRAARLGPVRLLCALRNCCAHANTRQNADSLPYSQSAVLATGQTMSALSASAPRPCTTAAHTPGT